MSSLNPVRFPYAMLKIAILLGVVWGAFLHQAKAQTVKDQIQQDTLTYIYKLNNAQLKYIFEKNGIKDTAWFFTNKIDSFSISNYDPSKLPNGCFLKTHVVGHKLNVQFIANYPFELRTKTIKNNQLVFLFDIKTKANIRSAQLTIHDRPSPYDAGFGAYVLDIADDDKKKNKYIRVAYQDVDYYFYLNGTANYIPAPSSNKGVESSISPGYFMVSQPKFRHYDTVKYKAYLLNPYNGKPLRKKATMRISGNGKTYWTKKIKRKSLGAYYDQFVLPDSLIIDKEYSLQISYDKRGRTFYNTESFRLEDYQLDKNRYEVILPKDTFKAGEQMIFYSKATDANGFALGDTRLKINMSVESVLKTYQDTIIFKKDEKQNWYSLDTIMDELEPTKIIIPTHRLLNGLIKYKITFDLIDVRQEKKQFVRYAYWDAQKERTIFTQVQDTIFVRELYNLKDTTKTFDLLIYQNNKLLDSIRIATPYKTQVKYNYTMATLRSVDNEKTQSITIKQHLLNLVDLHTKRTHDSVMIHLQYPMTIPLHYKIYKNNTVVAEGATNKLSYAVRDNSKDDYYLLISSNLNGEQDKNYHFFKISQDEKALRITTNFPKEIYPGASVPVEITVTDYQHRAKEKINITSYAISSMFKDAISEPNIVSPLAKVAQLQELPIEKSRTEYTTRNLSLSQSYNLTAWMVKEFNLYKNDFYKIYYPLQNTYTHYLPLPERTKTIDLIDASKTITEKAPTQFALLPILGQRIVRPSYVRMNKELVYNSSSHIHLPYSTAIDAGSYTVEFRFEDHLIRVKNVVVKPNQKTLLCVSMDSILATNNRQFIVADSLPNFAMTADEFKELDESALFVSGLYFDTLKVYPLNDESKVHYFFGGRNMGYINVRDENFGVIALPPHSPTQKKFVLQYNGKTQILENDAYTATFLYDDKVSNKGFDTASAPLFPQEDKVLAYGQLLDHINTVYPPVIKNAEIKKVETAYFEPAKTLKEKYNAPLNYLAPINRDNQFIQFEITHEAFSNIVGFWIISKEDPKKSSYFQSSQTGKQLHHHYGGAGLYDIYLLFDTKEYVLFENQTLAVNDFWYINTQYLFPKAIEKETLLEPILQYNRLTQKPLEPFVNYPDESNLTTKIINSNKLNIAQIKGILQASNGSKIGYKEIYLERAGRFVQGATTNEKGEFEFLSVPQGNYMLKIFGDQLQPRYAYNITIDKNAVYTYHIEMKGKNYLQPDLQINENEVRLQIFQSKENTSIETYGNVYDLDTRAPLGGVIITYLSKGGNPLATYKSSPSGSFEIYTQAILEKSFDIKIEHPNYRTIILKDVIFIKTNANQLSVFMRTISNGSNLPLIMNMDLEEKTVQVQAEKPKESSYTKIKKQEEYSKYNGSDWGGIDGKIIDDKGEAVPFASIGAFEGGVLKGQSKSDINGNFKIKPLQPATYSLMISSVGFNKTELQGVVVNAGRMYTQNIILSKNSKALKAVVIKSAERLVRMDEPNSNAISMNEIRSMPSYSSSDALSTVSGVSRNQSYSSAAPISIGGDRSDGTLYLVDGIMMRGSAATANLEGKDEQFKENKTRSFNLFDAAKAKSLRTNFSNLGYWIPNLVSDKKGKAYATLNFPDDVTLWKSYIVAMGRDYYSAVQTNDIKSYKPSWLIALCHAFYTNLIS